MYFTKTPIKFIWGLYTTLHKICPQYSYNVIPNVGLTSVFQNLAVGKPLKQVQGDNF